MIFSLPKVDASEFGSEGVPLTERAREHRRDKPRALQVWEQASKICLEEALRADEIDEAARLTARGHWIKGQWHSAASRPEEACEAYATGLRAVREFGEDHSLHAIVLLEASSECASKVGEFDAGLDLLEEALSIRRRAYGENDPRVAPGLIRLATYFSVEQWKAMNGSQETIEGFYEEAVRLVEEGGASQELVDEILSSYGGYLFREHGFERYRAFIEEKGMLESGGLLDRRE